MSDASPAPTAPEPGSAAHRALQCARLDRLATLAMELAELHAARAKQELTAQEPAESAQPAGTPPAPPATASDATRNFARMASLVRHLTALEANIAEGRPSPLADPRRSGIRGALRHFLAAEPDSGRRTRLRRRIDEAIDAELAGDPHGTVGAVEIVKLIAADFEIKLPIQAPANGGGHAPAPARPPLRPAGSGPP